jgi:hypothetical protein
MSPVEFILHEPGKRFDEVHLVAGDLEGPRLQGGGHARQPQAAQGTFELGGLTWAWGLLLLGELGVLLPEGLIFADRADGRIGLRERHGCRGTSCGGTPFKRVFDGGIGYALRLE